MPSFPLQMLFKESIDLFQELVISIIQFPRHLDDDFNILFVAHMYRPPYTTWIRTFEIPCPYDTIYGTETQEHAFDYFVYNCVENMWISPAVIK